VNDQDKKQLKGQLLRAVMLNPRASKDTIITSLGSPESVTRKLCEELREEGVLTPTLRVSHPEMTSWAFVYLLPDARTFRSEGRDSILTKLMALVSRINNGHLVNKNASMEDIFIHQVWESFGNIPSVNSRVDGLTMLVQFKDSRILPELKELLVSEGGFSAISFSLLSPIDAKF